MMHAKQIYNKLKQAIRSDSRWLVIHSSLLHLQIPAEELPLFKWQLLKALRSLADEGYQLAFPAFTFSFARTGKFHQDLPSEVGVLADWVHALLGAQRTKHPIYSHVLLGHDISPALSRATDTCFGEQGIYGFFAEQDATVIMLGCDWSYCTSFHFYEEQFSVPYRYHKTFAAKDDSSVATRMFVRDENLTVKNDFSKWLVGAKQSQTIFHTDFAQGSLQSICFSDLGRQCQQDLKDSPLAYVRDSALLAQQLSERAQAQNQAALNVMVLAESNYEPWCEQLTQAFAQTLPNYQLALHQNDYGQMANDILSGKLADLDVDFCFMPSRLEDLLHLSDVQFADDVSVSGLQTIVDQYIHLIQQAAQQVQRLVFVNLFSVGSVNLGQAALGLGNGSHLVEIIVQLNQRINTALAEQTNVRLLPIDALALTQYLDPRLWYLGKIPYSTEGFSVLANHYAGLIAHECGASTRLLVLDLDNTLWGGVLGEDGLQGIQLGGDFPGNAFKDFQRVILALHDRGIALALASKNDETLALEAIDQHPDMLIKTHHLATYRINWDEKAANIIAMADEVGLSLSHVMFIDDNPLECEKVRKLCPAVKVVELPSDPVESITTLMASPFLKASLLTAEDSKRAQHYAQQRQQQAAIADYQHLDDYFASLNIEVTIEPVNDLSFNRAVQLTNKTNQFNTTTRRFSDKQLRELLADKQYQVMTVSYQDQATEREIIGLFICHFAEQHCQIELLLLSCRVLGRSIETAMLSSIEALCRARAVALIQGQVVITERNTPVRDVFARHSFEESAEQQWQLQLKESQAMAITIPDWLTLHTHSNDG